LTFLQTLKAQLPNPPQEIRDHYRRPRDKSAGEPPPLWRDRICDEPMDRPASANNNQPRHWICNRHQQYWKYLRAMLGTRGPAWIASP
jgi:hypothetical protein